MMKEQIVVLRVRYTTTDGDFPGLPLSLPSEWDWSSLADEEVAMLVAGPVKEVHE